jgi:peptidoglycan/xylan/chitin deacetylase (PgdA/CDA1 family)
LNKENFTPAGAARMWWLAILIMAGLIISGCESRSAFAAPNLEISRTPTRAATMALAAQTSTTAPTKTATPMPTITATARPSITSSATIPAGYRYHPPGSVSVPILLYHNVSNRGSTNYVIRPANFHAQMKFLFDAGYQTVTVSQLASVIRDGGYLPENAVVITFDDGYLGVHENAFPILEAFGFNAVVYIISGTVATDRSYGYLQKEQVDELVAAGWEIGSHSISHSSLKTTALGLRNEIEKSKAELEEKLGIEIRSFSYPYNITNDWIKSRVEEYGYNSAVGVDSFVIHKPERLYFLSRREVFRITTMREFQALLVPSKYELNLENELMSDAETLLTPGPAR